jgi:RUN and FYVE domain-containing protein 1/2
VVADLEKTKKDWDEAQKTLEELGVQLSVSKLQLSEIRDKADRKEAAAANVALDSSGTGWTPDKMQQNCKGCEREFNIARRKHHCRKCGDIFCAQCSNNVMPLPNEDGQLGKPVRVCDTCWAKMTAPR